MDGLPPLPKSLSGLLNFSRESLSRAEATLGLRNPPGAGGPPTPQNSQTPKANPNNSAAQHHRQKTPPNFAPR